jgi:hypothetical protein
MNLFPDIFSKSNGDIFSFVGVALKGDSFPQISFYINIRV